MRRARPNSPDAEDRLLARCLLALGLLFAAMGVTVAVAGANALGEGVLLGRLLTLACAGPWVAGAAAILRGELGGYWGFVGTGIVAAGILGLALLQGWSLAGLPPFALAIGPALLGMRRLSERRRL